MLSGAAEYTRCPTCGTSVSWRVLDDGLHRCDAVHVEAFRDRLVEPELAAFDGQLAAWLETPQGRFAVYDAARSR